MRRDDTLWKGLIEDLFPEFLQFFYPQAQGLLVGDASVDFLDKELKEPPGGAASAFIVDKLVRVRTTAPEEGWILMHVEVQGYRQPGFSKRMYKYFNRIQDMYDHPITAIAIVMGEARKTKDFYEEESLGTSIQYKYNVYNIHTIDETELYKSRNPFSLIVQAARLSYEKGRMPDNELADQFVGLFDVLSERELSARKKMSIWTFMRNCVQFENPEMYEAFDHLLEQVTTKNQYMGVIEMLEERSRLKGLEDGLNQGRKEGRKEGRNEGRDEMKEKVVHNLLEILHLPDEQIAQVVGVSQDFIEAVKQQMN